MLNTDYLTLIQDKYTSSYTTGLNNLSDLSSLLANSKTDTSRSDYAQKIVDVANADAQNDIKNGNTKSWQNSEDYLNLKDEYVASGMTKNTSKYSTYDWGTQIILQSYFTSTNENESFLSKINRQFAQAMNATVTKTMRETEFDLKYNYAYAAYKSNYNASKAFEESSLDVTI